MKKYVLLVAFGALMLPAWAFDPMGAYQVRPPQGCVDKDITTQSLNLEDLIQISLCTNPALASQYMNVKAQEASLGTSRAEYLPAVTLTGVGQITGDKIEGGNYMQDEPIQGKVEASWLLFNFGGREANTRSIRLYTRAAEAQYNAAVHNLLLSVQTAYLNLLAAQESLVSAKASLDTYKQSYEEAQKRYKLGMVSLSDKLQAKTRYEQSLLAVVQQENRVKQYSGELAVLINLHPDTPISLVQPTFNDQDTEIANDNVQELMTQALEKRPELLAQQNTQEAAKANLTAARAHMLPSLRVAASAALGDNWKHHSLYATNNAAGLVLQWPIFSGFANMYAAEQASYLYKQSQNQTENVKRQVENEVWSAYQNYKTAERSYEISKTVLESAEENHRVAFRYYEVGKTDILNLLSAVAQLADARQNKITAFYSLLLSKANLYRSIGE
ncbi:TolC family protein [Candidatus Avelusimicrobium luingense]|uniref:TolC family protein n=1 Tax=Candidatus Avelusimicrobium luingense TaxID=3416211 RepID=UPI003D0A59A2